MSDFDLTLLRSRLADLADQGRTALLPSLHIAQDLYGWLPEPVAAEVGRILRVPLAEVHGVIEFYSLFYPQPAGKTVVRICTDPACALAGGEEVLGAVCRHLKIDANRNTPDGAYRVERAPCLGLCEHAPAALVNETAIAPADPARANDLCQARGARPRSLLGGTPPFRLLANCGKGRPTTLAEYVDAGGYNGLRKALDMPPQSVIAEVKASGLVGRGGAAFPTGIKWEGAANAPGETRYVVCNADESEPGTFKDRVLMEEDPGILQRRVLQIAIRSSLASKFTNPDIMLCNRNVIRSYGD